MHVDAGGGAGIGGDAEGDSGISAAAGGAEAHGARRMDADRDNQGGSGGARRPASEDASASALGAETAGRREADDMSSTLSSALHRYAMLLYHQGNTTGAERLLKKAIETDDRHVAALADYACLKHRLRREYQQADELYERVLNLEPGNVQTLCNSAWLHYTKDFANMDTEKASSYLKLALERAPGDPNALHMMARIQSEVHGELDEAERMYKLALHHCPHHLDCLWSYGAFLQVVRSLGHSSDSSKAAACALRCALRTSARMRERERACELRTDAAQGGPARPDMHERLPQDFRDDELGAQTYYARALAADPMHLNLIEHQAADAPLDDGAQVGA